MVEGGGGQTHLKETYVDIFVLCYYFVCSQKANFYVIHTDYSVTGWQDFFEGRTLLGDVVSGCERTVMDMYVYMLCVTGSVAWFWGMCVLHRFA